MSVFSDEMPKNLKDAYSVVGNQSRQSLKNMVRALSLHPWRNTVEDRMRLEAAKVILRKTQR